MPAIDAAQRQQVGRHPRAGQLSGAGQKPRLLRSLADGVGPARRCGRAANGEEPPPAVVHHERDASLRQLEGGPQALREHHRDGRSDHVHDRGALD